jgi:hypothetical protein
MLSSPTRSAEDFRSAAGEVRLQLSDVSHNGTLAEPPGSAERASVRSLLDLLQIGGRYAVRPNGSLDTSGSSPETLDLAGRLTTLVPGELKRVKDSRGRLDMRIWSRLASETLESVRAGQSWDEFGAEKREFVTKELLPFLTKLLDQSPEELEE